MPLGLQLILSQHEANEPFFWPILGQDSLNYLVKKNHYFQIGIQLRTNRSEAEALLNIAGCCSVRLCGQLSYMNFKPSKSTNNFVVCFVPYRNWGSRTHTESGKEPQHIFNLEPIIVKKHKTKI